MGLRRSGLRLVAEDANQFFATLRRVNNAYQTTERLAIRVANQLNAVDTASTTLSRNLSSSSQRIRDNLRNISQGASGIVRAMNQAGSAGQRAGRDINAGIAPVENSVAELRQTFRQARRDLENLSRTDARFEDQAREVQDLNRQLAEYRSSIRGTRRDVDAADDSLATMSRTLRELRQRFRNLSAEERRGDIGQRLLRNIQGLDRQLRSADRSLGQTQRNVGNYQSALERLTGAFPALQLGAGAAFAALIEGARRVATESLAEFQQLETGLGEVFTLTPDLDDAGLRQITEDVRDLAVDIGRTTDVVIPALYAALSAGVPQDTVFDFLTVANQAAIGGATDLQNTVGLLTGAVNAYGSDVLSVAQASDVLFTTVRVGTTTIPELAASLSSVTPIAGELGVSFNELGAQIATITAVTQNTAEATVALNGLYSELNSNTGRAGVLFERLAGTSFREFIAAGNSVQDALKLLEEEAARNNTTLSNFFSNIQSRRAALLLTGDATERYTRNLEELRDVSGATEQAAGRLEDTLSRQQDSFNAARESLLLTIGEGIAPARQRLLELGTTLLQTADANIQYGRANDDLRETLQGLGLSVFNLGDDIALTNSRLRDAGISYGDFQDIVRDLGEEFDGTAEELLELAEQVAFNNLLADLSVRRWRQVGTTYNEVEASTMEVSHATSLLRQLQAELGMEIAESRQEMVVLTGTQLQQERQAIATAAAQRDLAEALQAVGVAAVAVVSSNLGDIFEPDTGGGGGGGSRILTQLEQIEQREEEIAELRLENEEEIAELREENEEAVAELREDLNERVTDLEEDRDDRLAENREDHEERIENIRLDALDRIAQAERAIAEERQAAIEEFNNTQAEGFLDNVEAIENEERATAETRAEDFVEGLAETGIGAERTAALAENLGVVDDEVAAQALADTIADNAVNSILAAVAEGAITDEQAAEAIRQLEEQLAQGITDIELPFGIQLLSAAEIAAEFARRAQAELDDIRAQAAEDIRVADIQNAERVAEILEESNERINAAREATEQRIADRNEALNERIADRNEAVDERAQEIRDQPFQEAVGGGGRAREEVSPEEERQQQVVLELLDEAQAQESIELQRELTEQALELALAFGLVTEAQVEQQLAAFDLEVETRRLFESQELVNEATRDGETLAQNQAQALILLQGGFVTTAEQAAALAGTLSTTQVQAFIEARNAGRDFEQALADVGVNLDELPDETRVAILGVDQATEVIDAIEDELAGLPREVRIAIIAEEQGAPVAGGTQAAPDSNRPTGLNRGGRFNAGEAILVGDDALGRPTQFSELLVPDFSGQVVNNSQFETARNVLEREANGGSTPMASSIQTTTVNNNQQRTFMDNRQIDRSTHLHATYTSAPEITDVHDFTLLAGIVSG